MRIIAIAAVMLTAGAAMAAEPTLLELMKQTIDPAANAFWAAGNDAPEGETAEAAAARWQAAADGAAKMETYGKLMLEAPHVREGEWAVFAKTMAEAGASGRAAAQARDMDAAFEAGGKLYDACAGCHAKYIPGRS